jgi:hypothetical protein
MKNFIVLALLITAFVAFCYGMWEAKRWFNYNFGYNSQVEETVKKMVKKECLNNN